MSDSTKHPADKVEHEADRRAAMARRKPVIQAVMISIVLALVPATFAGMMVWAMADPLNRLDRVPAAVVNQDHEVTIDSGDDATAVNLGKEIVDNLNDDPDGSNFAWTTTDLADANAGLAEGRYYVVLTIPATFSADATSTASSDPEDPRTATLTVTTNDALNYLTGTIAKAMATSISDAVSQKVASKYVENMQLHLNDMHDNLATAVDKTTKLVDGAGTARTGAGRLLDGLATLKEKAAEIPAKVDKLHSGAQKLVAGAQKLSTGAGLLYTGAQKLDAGAATALAGANNLGTGAKTMATNLATMASGADKLSAALAQLKAGYASMSDAQRQAIIDQLATQSAALASGSSRAAAGAQNLASGTDSLVAGLQSLRTGAANELAGATSNSAGAAKELAGARNELAGSARMAANMPLLVTGTKLAYDGGAKLYDGLGNMETGAGKLQDKLTEGAANVPSYTAAQLATLPDLTSDAVTLEDVHANPIAAFGEALAPFFLSIALWIGGLAFFVVNPPLSVKAVQAGRPVIVVFLRSLVAPAVVALAQALLAVWAVHVLVGVDVSNLSGLALLTALASFAFMAVNQCFGALFGPPGRFFSILFLILQAASAGVVFPLQTAPAFVQWLAGALPMNHAVQGFRSLIAGGSLGEGPAVAMLAGWLVAGLVLTLLGVLITVMRSRRDADRTRPAVVAPLPGVLSA